MAGPLSHLLTSAALAASLGFGSCLRQEDEYRPYTVFQDITAADLDLFLLLGDSTYQDLPLERFCGTCGVDMHRHECRGGTLRCFPNAGRLPDFNSSYQRMLADEPFLQLLAKLPVGFMWDDHELFDNYASGDTPYFRAARDAFVGHLAYRNPPPVHEGNLYFIASVHGAEVFVLDGRTHRSATQLHGEVQKQALLAWLASSTARWKVIASGTMVSNLGSAVTRDGWSTFPREKDEILRFIADRQLAGVAILSGDSHFGAVIRVQVPQRPGCSVLEVAASPLAANPFAVPAAPKALADEVLFTTSDKRLWGVLRFSHDVLQAEIRAGPQVLFEHRVPWALPCASFKGESIE